MSKITLSRRLTMIAHKIRPHSRVADIGTDHALLPVYLAANHMISFAVASDYHAGPIAAAREQVQQTGLQHMIDVRQGDGLDVIEPGEVDAITIAGMGGALMTNILQRGREKLAGVRQLILQPNVGEHLVRHWLFDHGWRLVAEDILLEDDHIYEILHAEKEDGWMRNGEQVDRLYDPTALHEDLHHLSQDDLFRFGPYLLRNPCTIFIQKWRNEAAKLRHIIGQLSASKLAESKEKLAAMQKQLDTVEEVIQCALKVIPSSNGSNN